MRKKIFFYALMAGIVLVVLHEGCHKDKGYYKAKAEPSDFSGSSYEFLKSQTGIYDSFLYVMDRVGLTDSLKTGEYTVFAPTNASFEEAIIDVNRLRAIQGRPPIYLATIPLNQLDTMASRYLIRGTVSSDSMNTQDGITLTSVLYDYPMHGKLVANNAEGMVKGGPKVIEYSDTKGVIYTRQWNTSTTVTIDIKTNNGLVNVLERNHIFGFGEFINRVNPTFSQPFSGVPLPIPGPIGFEQFDKGGERVAYHDVDAGNNGGQYRTSEGVDIGNAHRGENGYIVGWTSPNEWMNYTVDIAEAGYYQMFIRAASPGHDGSIHLEIDNRRVSEAIKIPGTTSYDVYQNKVVKVGPFPKGRHILKVVYDYANYDLRFMKFMPFNRPHPVPGAIAAEEFDQGGEGVAYHDNDDGNNGGKYRTTEGVDIEFNKVGGGFDIGWTNADEWMMYTINVEKTGQYNLTVRAGSPHDPDANGSFRVEIDGQDITGPMDCPNTGGYQNWADVTKLVNLTKGVHKMRFYELSGRYNVRSFTFSTIE